jgi:D-arabinose 1-dehydrogenase-like Zn-dependent alcohol dehydrogenase
MEIWKTITDFTNYEVSSYGNVRNKITNYILKPIKHSTGYSVINLCGNNTRKTTRLHKIVATHFIYNEFNDECINHINGIKSDNRVENLEWISQRENVTHSYLKIKKTSKYHGVSFSKSRNKFIARVRIDNKVKSLGWFINEIDAYNEVLNFLKENNIKNKYV